MGWNVSTPPSAVRNEDYPHAFDFKTGKVKFAALGQVSPRLYGIDLNNFAPRVDLAWQPGFLRGTTIRAGAGTYYTAENAIYELFANTAPGVAIVQSITNQSSVTPTYILGQNVFPPMSQVKITQGYAVKISRAPYSISIPTSAQPESRERETQQLRGRC